MSGLRRSALDYFDPYTIDSGGYDGFGLGIDRRGFAPVSDRAYNAFDKASELFFEHLASVDTSKGDVQTEIIKFHLVPYMRKRFNRLVKEHGCRGTSRQLSRQEQDAEPGYEDRNTLIWFTSVKVTPAAQKAYLDKNPSKRPATADASTSAAAAASTAAPPPAVQRKSFPLSDTTDTMSKKRNVQDANLDADAAPNSDTFKKSKTAAVAKTQV